MPPITFAPTDAYAVMNSLVRQATGQSNINVVDSSTFISAGKTVLDSGIENVYNSISVLISRTIIDSLKYKGKLKLIVENTGAFENRVRKISFYARDNQASGMYNTNLYTNLGAGLDDTSGTGSMWEQNPSIPLEINFFSSFAWDKSHTEYPEQTKLAFNNESSFIDFINGMMIEVQNDIESTLEAKNKLVILDRIAGTKYLVDNGDLGNECAVNLTKEFNDTFGTAYTTKEILNEHAIAFIKFFIARFKIDSKRLTNRTALYHDPMTKTIDGVDYSILRHTPVDRQKFVYYEPLFTQLDLNLSEIFNPEMLQLPNGEGVDHWQSFTNPSAIDITPALPEGAVSSEVKMDLVLGLLFDTDSIMVSNKFTGMYQTPINARHVFTNLWWHYNYGVCQDYTHSAILYYMSDDYLYVAETFAGDGTETDFVLTGNVGDIISVTVNGTATTAYEYDSEDKTITFTTAPADESVIVVTYMPTVS